MDIINEILNTIVKIVYSLFSLLITIPVYFIIIVLAAITGFLKGGLNEVAPSIKYVLNKNVRKRGNKM